MPISKDAMPDCIAYINFNDPLRQAQIFEEIAQNLQHALYQLGRAVPIVNLAYEPVKGTRPIVLGANQVAIYEDLANRIPKGSIIYNFEQVAAYPERLQSYLNYIQPFEIWDYSRRNSVWLRDNMNARAFYCPYGYTELMHGMNNGAEQRPYDFTIYGTLTERRQGFAFYAAGCGYKPQILPNAWGAWRMKRLTYSKAALAIHANADGMFDLVRHIQCWTQGVPIFSEHASDHGFLDTAFKEMALTATYRGLLSEFDSYKNDPLLFGYRNKFYHRVRKDCRYKDFIARCLFEASSAPPALAAGTTHHHHTYRKKIARVFP